MRPLLRLATVIAGLLLLTTLPAAPARAIGGETFGCRTSPGTVLTYKQLRKNNRPTAVARLRHHTARPMTTVHGRVTFSRAGQSVTRQSSAYIRIYCGSVPC